MAFQTVCQATDIPKGKLKGLSAGGVSIVVYHLPDGFHATQASCTHVFAPLARGKIVDECNVQCPFHRARFDIRSGKVVEWATWPPGVATMLNIVRGKKDLKTYPVRVKDGEVQVDV